MKPGDPDDPLLRQVVPVLQEEDAVDGFAHDFLHEAQARIAPGMLVKYPHRALLVTTGTCAIHCRYCFRRHYPYHEEPQQLDAWAEAFSHLERDPEIHEVLLSGGDPLMLSDARLAAFVDRLTRIPHIKRLRFHTRLPIVLPERITPEFVAWLKTIPRQVVMVVHANHPQEISGDCEQALRELVQAGIPTLNQAVLLKGINDDATTLIKLSERLINIGVLPYYLHQLDHVTGTAHFAVSDQIAMELVGEMRRHLPGYAVPQLVREIPGQSSKVPVR